VNSARLSIWVAPVRRYLERGDLRRAIKEVSMRYVLAIIGEEGGWEDVTPEQMKEAMERWGGFDDRLLADGVWVAGDGLQPSATATTVRIGEGEATVTDGPFAETKEQLGGFYLLECDTLDEALDYAKQVPARPGSSIEVRPVMDYGEFGYVHPLDRDKAAS
jgi:hypothetical protein